MLAASQAFISALVSLQLFQTTTRFPVQLERRCADPEALHCSMLQKPHESKSKHGTRTVPRTDCNGEIAQLNLHLAA